MTRKRERIPTSRTPDDASAATRPRGGPQDGTRLQKYLAHAGVAARRRAETEFIAAGRVSVDGVAVTDPACRVRPGQVVRVDGRVVRPEAPVVILLHKPVGVVSAARDPRGRQTAVDLAAGAGVRLYPVGRLDTDSEGLLLLTNDGALTHALLHPRHRVPRVYCALVRPRPEPAALVRLEAGVRLSDGPARAEDVLPLARAPRGIGPGPGAPDAGWISLSLREGRNREARRMCAAVGLEVLRLVRTRFGGLHLGALRPGESRALSAPEVEALWRDAGLRPPAVGEPGHGARAVRPRGAAAAGIRGRAAVPGTDRAATGPPAAPLGRRVPQRGGRRPRDGG